MLEAVVARPELSVLHVADEVLGEERVALPEAVREVDAAPGARLLRTWEADDGAPDDGPIDLEPQHDVRSDARRQPREIVTTVGPDEVREDMPSGPVAAREARVIEREPRRPRILESPIEPVLAEEAHEVRASYPARCAPLRKNVRREPVAHATAGAAFATAIVPVELPIEPKVAAWQEIAIDVAESKIGVEPEEGVGSLFRTGGIVSEGRIEREDRAWVLAQGQIRAPSVEQNGAAGAELQERERRERQPHAGEFRKRMIPALLELSQEDQRLHRPHPLADPGQQERLGGAEADLVERRRVAGEHQAVAVAGTPRQTIATDEELDVPEGELHIARRQTSRAIILVLEELRLNVEGQEVAELGAALERQPAVDAPPERAPLSVDQGELAARIPEKRLRAIDGGERHESRGGGCLRRPHTQARELDLELFHEPIQDWLEITTRVEIAHVVAGLGDGARDASGRLGA